MLLKRPSAPSPAAVPFVLSGGAGMAAANAAGGFAAAAIASTLRLAFCCHRAAICSRPSRSSSTPAQLTTAHEELTGHQWGFLLALDSLLAQLRKGTPASTESSYRPIVGPRRLGCSCRSPGRAAGVAGAGRGRSCSSSCWTSRSRPSSPFSWRARSCTRSASSSRMRRSVSRRASSLSRRLMPSAPRSARSRLSARSNARRELSSGSSTTT